MALPLPKDDSRKAAAVAVTVRLDHVAAPVTLTLPLRPRTGWIGLHPRADKAFFPENSVAAFDILAVDAEGKRRLDNARKALAIFTSSFTRKAAASPGTPTKAVGSISLCRSIIAWRAKNWR